MDYANGQCQAYFASPHSVFAATEEDKQAAIDAALMLLADSQEMDGRWRYSGGVEDVAAKGAALLAFLEEGYRVGDGSSYASVVENGLNYILSQATIYNISDQPAGNPDSNGNGFGIKFVPGGNNIPDGACGMQDPGDICNWFEHYAEFLVESQNEDGSWNVPSTWGGPLSWGWYVNILNATRIVNNPPVADANGPYSVDLGNPFILDGSGSYAPDLGDSIVSWEWDLDGDGLPDALGETLAVPTGLGTLFPNAGSYPIGLTVTDTGEKMDTDFTIVNVRPPGHNR